MKVVRCMIFTALLFSCSELSETRNIDESPSQVVEVLIDSEDLDELGKLVDLSRYKPLAAHWDYSCRAIPTDNSRLLPGPCDYVLRAELRFDQEMLREIEVSSKLLSVSPPMVTRDSFLFDWLSEENKEIIRSNQGNSITAHVFMKNSLIHGGMVILNNQTILVFLHTA